jgi:hypothetical protein
MVIQRDLYPVHSPQVVGRVVGDEAVLVIPGKGEVKVLNEVGARLWSLADGQHTIAAMAAVISTEYETEPSQAEADALEFVEQLMQKGVLVLLQEPIAAR